MTDCDVVPVCSNLLGCCSKKPGQLLYENMELWTEDRNDAGYFPRVCL